MTGYSLSCLLLILGVTCLGCAGDTATQTAADQPAGNAEENSLSSEATEGKLVVNLRHLDRDELGVPLVQENTEAWDPTHTAIIVCDMWDDHWCQGAAARVGELAGPMNAMLTKARTEGVFIIHAPSSVTAFYENTPARELALQAPYAETPVPLSTEERWGTTWCWPDTERDAAFPIDDSDMGCDCAEKCEIREAWSSEIATLEIHEGDAVTDNAQETYNLLEERGIDNVIICGVHLNMCVLGRPFGIRQLTYVEKNVVLMRDMTDTMYNHEMPPEVNHFAGTDLVVAHIEEYWCPSMASTDITGEPPFRFREDTRPVE